MVQLILIQKNRYTQQNQTGATQLHRLTLFYHFSSGLTEQPPNNALNTVSPLVFTFDIITAPSNARHHSCASGSLVSLKRLCGDKLKTGGIDERQVDVQTEQRPWSTE